MNLLVVLAAIATEAPLIVPPPPPAAVDHVFPPAGSVVPLNTRFITFGAIRDADDIGFIVEGRFGQQAVPSIVAHPGDDVDDDDDDVGLDNALVLTLPVDAPGVVVGAELELIPSCGTCGDTTYLFDVGDAVDDVAPAFADIDVDTLFNSTDFRDTTQHWTVLQQLPDLVGDEPVIYGWRRAGVGEIDVPLHFTDTVPGGGNNSIVMTTRGAEGDTVCFDVFAVDAAGNESAALPLCIELVDESFSCAPSSSAAASSFGLLGLALLLVRRRH